MKSLGKIAPVLALSCILSACGTGETSSSDVAGSDPVTPVPETNEAPVISGTPTTSVDEGSSYLFTPSASDEDGDSLSFSIANRPDWASFDSDTGTLSGTPGSDDAGSYADIVISVSDGELSDALSAFTITVNDVEDDDPVVTDPDPVETNGAPTLVSVSVSGSDILLSWVQNNAVPEGGYDIFIDSVDTGSQYRTTATTTSIGSLDLTVSHCFSVESRYTDTSEFYSSNELCSVAQEAENQVPTISGTPADTVTVGDAYSFTPSASDPDGDDLSFTVSNLPDWLSFDSGTGSLTGTPEESDVGVYNNVLIIVSDGEESVSLTAFSITVEEAAAPVTGSITLNWTAPATRADGSALDISEIGGYCIYLGQTSDSLEMVMDISDGSAVSYILEDLEAGSYFVAISAYDVDGNDSGFSNVIEKSISESL